MVSAAEVRKEYPSLKGGCIKKMLALAEAKGYKVVGYGYPPAKASFIKDLSSASEVFILQAGSVVWSYRRFVLQKV